ncbi:MAG: extracellular solute-binding protein [bacterium]|nr:extracellular solute-binding protein [bacterium]
MRTQVIRRLLPLLLLGTLVLTAGFRCTLVPQKVRELLKPVTLDWWRVYDSPSDLSDIINSYRAIHPNVSVNVRTLRYEEFRDKLLEAYAKRQEPDIISMHVGWLRHYLREGFVQPMPASVTMAYQKTQKTLGVKEEVLIEQRTTTMPSLGQLQAQYLDTVVRDIMISGKVYGFPLSVDTLALFYNRALFNAAGIPLPPASWNEFQEMAAKLTLRDADGNIQQAGAALGTGTNVRRGVDVLSLLLMQNGTYVMAEGGAAQFHVGPSGRDAYHPGLEALRFYTDFANPTKEVYSWNGQQPDSISAFAANRVAMTFGYSFDLAEIKAASRGRLNMGVVPVPQLPGANANVASYWVETVSSRTNNLNEAWDFLLHAAKAEVVKTYLAKTGKPTALRALVNDQKASDQLGPFAGQLLTARTWYYGFDMDTGENVMRELIEVFPVSGETPARLMTQAARRLEETSR